MQFYTLYEYKYFNFNKIISLSKILIDFSLKIKKYMMMEFDKIKKFNNFFHKAKRFFFQTIKKINFYLSYY